MKARHDEDEQNSNQRVVQADGSVKYGLNQEQEAQYKKDVEDKAAAIRKKFKDQADQVK